MLVIHDDGDVLDSLTRLFEGSGFEVHTAVTGYRAQSMLESDKVISVVIAPWTTAHPVGGEVYRWSLHARYDLRDQFVFLADEVTAEFDRVVGGRCLAISITRPLEVVRVASAAVKRRAELDAQLGPTERDRRRPSLLLAEDEPILLSVMASLFDDGGYEVTEVESGLAAIAALDQEDFDVVIADWTMDEGSGEDVYRWIQKAKPWLVERVVFLTGSGGETEHVNTVAPGRPTFRKGADASALTSAIKGIAASARMPNDAETVRPGTKLV